MFFFINDHSGCIAQLKRQKTEYCLRLIKTGVGFINAPKMIAEKITSVSLSDRFQRSNLYSKYTLTEDGLKVTCIYPHVNGLAVTG